MAQYRQRGKPTLLELSSLWESDELESSSVALNGHATTLTKSKSYKTKCKNRKYVRKFMHPAYLANKQTQWS